MIEKGLLKVFTFIDFKKRLKEMGDSTTDEVGKVKYIINFIGETFMSHWLMKNDENSSQDSRDTCRTRGGNFIISRTGKTSVKKVFSGEDVSR